MLGLSHIQATRAYIYGLSVLALAALAGWLYLFGLPLSWIALGTSVVLAAVCAASRRFPVDFGKDTVEIPDVATLTALAFLGPVWALLVAVPSMLYRDRLRTVYEAATYTAILLAGGYVFQLFAKPLFFTSRFDPPLVYAIVVAGVVYHTLDALIGCVLLRLKYGTPLSQSSQEFMLPAVPSNVTSILTVLGTSYAIVAFGPAAALVLFCGTAGALIALHLIHGRQKENEALRAENAGLLSSSLTFAGRLVESLGLRDGYTARHAAASAVYAADTARELGLEHDRVDKLKVAALLQNVGLVSVPDEALLTPPKKLNSVGRMHLERHPAGGEGILAGVPGFEEAAKWVRWHHERVDGSGYPDRLRGEWIPLEARILAVAESYASLILDGPHAPALPPLDARRELVDSAGRSLDRRVVRTLLMILDTKDENYASAADDRFAFSPAAPGNGLLGETSSLRPADAAEAR